MNRIKLSRLLVFDASWSADRILLLQPLAPHPDRLGIGYPSATFQTSKALEAGLTQHLVLHCVTSIGSCLRRSGLPWPKKIIGRREPLAWPAAGRWPAWYSAEPSLRASCRIFQQPAAPRNEHPPLSAPTLLTPAALFSKEEIIIRRLLADQLLIDLHRRMGDRAGQFSARSIAVVNTTIACNPGG